MIRRTDPMIYKTTAEIFPPEAILDLLTLFRGG